ncbi:MAG TPA: SAM-dependent chlorinase/fluorinase [Herpetosiphonaceae bacterium]
MQPNGFVTLTTDFGQFDAYVAMLKGVLLTINPASRPVDYTHEIGPQQIAQAAYLLHTGYRYFPAGTVHLVVVDPGVGSSRKALALVTPEAAFVAPDNGVLTYVWEESLERWGRGELRLVELSDPRWWRPQVSTTFHGRDIFAPAAAHLTLGTDPAAFGPALDAPVLLPLSRPVQRADGTWEGRIIHVDHFGNCITNLTRAFLDQHAGSATPVISILDQRISHIHRTYGESEWGTVMALIGSSERLELAVRNGNAAKMLGVGVGDPLRVSL